MLRLFLLFTVVPIIELFILIRIDVAFGALTSIGIVILTGLLGAFFVRRHGFRVWGDIQREMEKGYFPANQLLDGLLILIAGIVLITPGIITDIFGFTLLFPVTRRLYKRLLNTILKRMMEKENYSFSGIFREKTIRDAETKDVNEE